MFRVQGEKVFVVNGRRLEDEAHAAAQAAPLSSWRESGLSVCQQRDQAARKVSGAELQTHALPQDWRRPLIRSCHQ